jgi:hypothetical protein
MQSDRLGRRQFIMLLGGVAVVQPLAAAALASEASGQRGNFFEVRAPDTRPEPGSSARAALASEASGQRGNPF